jgi:hypothetical protein
LDKRIRGFTSGEPFEWLRVPSIEPVESIGELEKKDHKLLTHLPISDKSPRVNPIQKESLIQNQALSDEDFAAGKLPDCKWPLTWAA